MTGNNVTIPKVTGKDLKVTSFDWKSPGSGCRSLKTLAVSMFHILQGCTSQKEAVTLKEMMLRAAGDIERPGSDIM